MVKRILFIFPLVGLLLFTACTNEGTPVGSDKTGEIRFAVIDTTEVGVTTRASIGFNVDDFNVSLSKGDISIFPISGMVKLQVLLLPVLPARITC